MINIVLPLAGRGSRFSNEGYKLPKPLLPINGKPMIEVVINNLRPVRNHRFIFICQKKHVQEFGLRDLFSRIAPGSVVIDIDYYTKGQLSSALLAKEFIDNDDPLVTANTDQYITERMEKFLLHADENNLDGLIMTMRGDNPKWSYVKKDPDTDLVIQTAEKRVISDEATVGIYYFRKGKEFLRAANLMISKQILVNGEFYICPTYNELIKDGKKVGAYNIGCERNGMFGLGVPDDYEYFLKTSYAENV